MQFNITEVPKIFLLTNYMGTLPVFIVHNRIGGVMVSVLNSSAVAREFEPRSGQIKTIKLVSVASTLSTQH